LRQLWGYGPEDLEKEIAFQRKMWSQENMSVLRLLGLV
jgi:hypothetical protein